MILAHCRVPFFFFFRKCPHVHILVYLLHLDVVGLVGLGILVRSLALRGPGVDVGNLVLEGGVYETMTLEGVETLELGRDDEGVEGLSAAACPSG